MLLTRRVRYQVLATALLSGCPLLASDLCVTVMDYSQLPLGSVFINATNLGTGKLYTARTDTKGFGCVSEIPAGLYSVETSLKGFLHVRYYPVRVTPSVKQRLTYWLPFAEISEGGIAEDSTLSGTLIKEGGPVQAAEVCIVVGADRNCTVTNDLGEYALVGAPAVYVAEIRTRDGKLYKSKIDMSTPGIYRNRLSVNDSDHP